MKSAQSRQYSVAERKKAVARAKAHSPFLREAMTAFPHIVDVFLHEGGLWASEAALNEAHEADWDVRLRQMRRARALAIALGDLAGELPLETVTSLLTDFADSSIGQALKAAMRERFPDLGAPGDVPQRDRAFGLR